MSTLTAVPGARRLASRPASTSPLRHLDPTLLVTVLALIAYGCVMVYSASYRKLEAAGVSPQHLLRRQLVWATIGLVVLVAVVLLDYRRYQGWAPLMYGVAIAVFLLVLTPLGTEVNGASGWFAIGPFQIQPAEYAKPVLVLFLASVAAAGKGELDSARFVRIVALAAVPMGLLALQPDLGSAMVYTAMLLAILLVAGARPRHLVILAVVGVVGLVGAFQLGFVKDYQKARLTAFMDPSGDAKRTGYNLLQSQTAIGSGGVTGKGLFKGSQTNLAYVPEQQTDFIFSAVGEELGFVGAVALLLLLGLLVWRGFRIAVLSRDFYGTLVATGVTAVIAFQAFLNIGVTMGIMPVTGVTLPLVSYGGSSLITTCILVGLLMNVHMRRMTTAPLP